MPFATIEEALEDIKCGRMLVVLDDEDRENEGDLVIAAEKASPEAINFMARNGRGLICLAMTSQRIRALQIPPMVPSHGNNCRFSTAFTISVDAKGTTTGISAFERSFTIQTLINENTSLDDLIMPGHIFPLEAKNGGILERSGHTEAAVELASLAGLYPAGVICEILADSGHMARLPELQEFAQEHDLKMITIADLIAYRRRHENLECLTSSTTHDGIL